MISTIIFSVVLFFILCDVTVESVSTIDYDVIVPFIRNITMTGHKQKLFSSPMHHVTVFHTNNENMMYLKIEFLQKRYNATQFKFRYLFLKHNTVDDCPHIISTKMRHAYNDEVQKTILGENNYFYKNQWIELTIHTHHLVLQEGGNDFEREQKDITLNERLCCLLMSKLKHSLSQKK